MGKWLAGVIAGVFVLGSTAVFAYKLEPMNQEQRTELRERADRLVAERDRESHRASDRESHRASDRDSHRARDTKHKHMMNKSSSTRRHEETSSGR